jgi:hypothetical protein
VIEPKLDRPALVLIADVEGSQDQEDDRQANQDDGEANDQPDQQGVEV